jgi:hypothetical protein
MLEKNHPTFLKSSQNSRQNKKKCQNSNIKGDFETPKQVKVLFNARQLFFFCKIL